MIRIKNKTNFIITSIVSMIAIAGGIGVGLYLGQEFITPRIDYSNFNETELEDNNKELYNKYLKLDSDSYNQLKPYEMVNIGLYKLSLLENFSMLEEGAVNASGIIQSINGKTIKYGNKYFNESISDSSLVHVAKRFYQENEIIDEYTGSVISPVEASYEEETKLESSLSDFEKRWGKTLSRGSIYVVSSKTVIDSSLQINDNKYKIKLTLDPITSVSRYVRQMKEMSSLSRYPEFSSVELNFVLDSSLNLITSKSIETYEVYKFGKHTSNGELSVKYLYDLDEEIPELNEPCIK